MYRVRHRSLPSTVLLRYYWYYGHICIRGRVSAARERCLPNENAGLGSLFPASPSTIVFFLAIDAAHESNNSPPPPADFFVTSRLLLCCSVHRGQAGGTSTCVSSGPSSEYEGLFDCATDQQEQLPQLPRSKLATAMSSGSRPGEGKVPKRLRETLVTALLADIV